MNVTVAKSAGFCFGVKRAVDAVYDEIKKAEGPIYTYGPIIHNEVVVNELAEKGVTVVNDLSELSELPVGTIIIRSHGVKKEEYEAMQRSGFHVVDATCPFVSRIHKIVEEEAEKGSDVIIIGNAGHPEVEGIKSCGKSGHIFVINSPEEARSYSPKAEKTVIVAQTTQNLSKFQELVEIIQKKEYDVVGYDIVVINTICNATEERQLEAAELAAQADAMIVIGGSQSSNTQKLVEICRQACERTTYIQTIRDLHVQSLRNCVNVGITAGASTPTNIIEEVQKRVRNEF